MGFHPISLIERAHEPVVWQKEQWLDNYKEAFTEHPHDTSQLTLVLPDDCLLVSGPPRLRHADGAFSVGDRETFHIIGFANNISYSETRNVQPLKAIGSRRHIFAATNQPVQINIARMMLLGLNTLRSLYSGASFGKDMYDRNSKYSNIDAVDDASWFSNLEEDVFRVPIGLGVIYNAPASLAGHMNMCAGADYFEACTVVSKQVSMQSNEAMIMEQVTLLADRALPWTSAANNSNLNNNEIDKRCQVKRVSDMA